MPFARTGPLREELARALPDRPFAVRFWDGSELPSTAGNGPVFTAAGPQALGHVLRAPGQLGVGRAYVSGMLEVDDLDKAIAVLDGWSPPSLDRTAKLRLAAAAARSMGLTPLPRPPASELAPKGRRHSIARDRRAVTHHYDVSNDFFALFLDDSMTYSCAIFEREDQPLEQAQANKREVVCRKLALAPGERMLDVGCGWGSLAVHAAKEHGVHVTGITLSEPQAARARARAEEAGVADRVEIRVQDYREPRGERYDAIASIGMVEHVGAARIDLYAAQLAALLKPGGRLLNHGIARLRHSDAEAGPFSERYVFPDAAPLHLSRVQFALERAGFETEHAEGYREHYARTLTHWLTRLEDRLDEATALAGPERVRVWRLYLRAARNGFSSGFTSVYQVRCRLPR
jgi:cyclopropane-fatty-acyl-phospholipid synthase